MNVDARALAAGTVAALCIAWGAGWGYCLAGLCNFAYYVGYPPLLYVTFLADFFREDEYELVRGRSVQGTPTIHHRDHVL